MSHSYGWSVNGVISRCSSEQAEDMIQLVWRIRKAANALCYVPLALSPSKIFQTTGKMFRVTRGVYHAHT
jgi:hypothetical protein